MRNRGLLIFVIISVVAAMIAGGITWWLWMSPQVSSEVAQQPTNQPTLEWFGWSHFRITSTSGTVFLTNPFITGNPDSAVTLDDITEVDYILVPNGHGDEVGDTIAIAQKTGAKVLTGGWELGSWLMQQGLPASQVIRSNPGNWHDLGGVTVRVVNSVHGSGLPQPTIENPYGGPAAGFFITLENGYTIYFAGSTAATMDMQLWGSLFKPDLAILPLNSDRDPIDVAQMVRLLSIDNPNLTRIIPHHQRVEPPAGATTIPQMEEAIRALAASPVAVLKLQRGFAVHLTK
jgi:L-ascorbate metabolism protein UlaG (beta-lactamase superfamily)